MRSLGAVAVSGLALLGYFMYEKDRLLSAKDSTTQVQSVGKPSVGGSFALFNQHGQFVTEKDYAGRYMLIYFGYTFCPDICPEELEKMAEIVNVCASKGISTDMITPIFISCDPKRDSVGSIRDYVKEFHPAFVGLTGTYNQIKKVAKAYRLYFSAPPQSLDEDDDDYLVDHSIFFYLMGPNGEYIEHFGRNDSASQVVDKIIKHIKKV